MYDTVPYLQSLLEEYEECGKYDIINKFHIVVYLS
nr:MAG TPA: hypothetical protein [Caudoviricetes sp.]